MAKKTATKAKAKIKKPKAVSTAAETNLIRRVTARPKNTNVATFSTGDTVNVFVKVKEGEKERVQTYKGTVTKVQGSGATRAFTVRKISAGVGVERTFPFSSPAIERVELLNIGNVRRARLYYLRGLEGKAAKIESTLVLQEAAPKETTKA